MNTVSTGSIIVFLALGAVVLTVAGFGCGGKTPDATSKQIDQPTASQASNTGLEALLSGETPARYQALPPAFQDALASYVWYGVPSALVPLAVRDKIEQWGDNAVPLDELISAKRAQRFRERDSPEEHADLLLSGYVYLLVSDNEPERRNELMRELARDPIGEASAAMGDEPDSAIRLTDLVRPATVSEGPHANGARPPGHSRSRDQERAVRCSKFSERREYAVTRNGDVADLR